MKNAAVDAALKEYGLLLVSDKQLPSLVSLVVGGPVSGSWWGHPKGHEIYELCCAIEDRKNVLAVKLIKKKVTFVQGRLWSAVLGVATAREPWQTEGLSKPARDLLDDVDAAREVPTKGRSKAAKELELCLLAYSYNVHTPDGHHEKVLESWQSWRKRVRWKGKALEPEKARIELEKAAATLGKGARLPWA